MKSFPLDSDMGNGASVKDWLGTCSAAARAASNNMEDVRTMEPDANLNIFTSRAKLQSAQLQLEQALDELKQVIKHTETIRKARVSH